jgi:hypothetical protein
MANIDETLLNQQTLADSNQQQQVANRLGHDQTQARNGLTDSASVNEAENLTEGQKRGAARKAQDEKVSAVSSSAAGSGGMSSGTSKLLKSAWMNMLDPFAIPLALAYLNIHWFLNLVLGESVFCEMGSEWVPGNLKNTPGIKSKIKTLGLLEKWLLFWIDVTVAAALGIVITIIVLIGSVMTGGFDVIVQLGWALIKVVLQMFDPNIKLEG